MSIAPDSKTPPTAIPTEMMRLPVGVASPLWGLFAGAAVTGAAWWWMTRWARPENLEALFSRTAKSAETALKVVETEVAALPAPVLEAAPLTQEVAVEAETVVEAVEAAGEPVVEAIEAGPEAAVETVEAVAAPVEEALETAAETAVNASESVVEAVFEVPETVEDLVGGESAPISPVLEALAETPKISAKRKTAKAKMIAADEG